jgi:hypothetical protein
MREFGGFAPNSFGLHTYPLGTYHSYFAGHASIYCDAGMADTLE